MNNRQQQEPAHCMVVHAYYPLGEPRVERQALALIENGFKVDVVSLKNPGEAEHEIVKGVNVYRLPVKRNRGAGFLSQFLEYLNFFVRAFFKLIKLHPEKRYQVVQVHNLPDFLVFSALYPKLRGAKVILDLHDLMPEFYASKTDLSMESFGTKLIILQEQMSCRFADHVITVTELWRQRLIDRGVSQDKISVVMNVADTRYFDPGRFPVAAERQKDEFHVIYHGTFKKFYGLGDLIEAAALVREKIPGLRVTVQGVGAYYDEMRRMVEEYGLEREVQINNYVIPMDEMSALISQADVGVVPNRNDVFNGDLLPTKMLEYVALEKPIVAAKTRVISHYFDESMVMFFKPGDARDLAEGIFAAYQEWQENSFKKPDYSSFTSKYRWDRISKEYVNLVRGLAGDA